VACSRRCSSFRPTVSSIVLCSARQLEPLRREFGAQMIMGSPPLKRVPLFAVGYTGWKQPATLLTKLTEGPVDGMWIWKQTGAWLLILAIGFSACGGFKDSMEDSKRATSALKSELGLDAQVSFRTMNGHTSVGVRLTTPPQGDAGVAKRNITDVVTRSFRAKVERVDISF